MKRLPLFALALLLVLTTAPAFESGRRNVSSASYDVSENLDGAFRDGLYLGRLAGESSAEPHMAIGRWARTDARRSFTAGYQQGYRKFSGGVAYMPLANPIE